MQTKFNIFYSWQSDLNSKENRNLIQNCIEAATKRVKKNVEFNIEINLDRDTKGKSGSPSISDTIFDKIRTSDIFICDVSIINKNILSNLLGNRLTPNPNVLIELGIAIEVLGWERVICINNSKHAAVESLPFDIRSHRISTYNSSNIKESKEILISILNKAISSIIDDYDKIVEAQKNNKYIKHDRGIFNKFDEILPFQKLSDSISQCSSGTSLRGNYVQVWLYIADLFKEPSNHYIDGDVQNEFETFIKELDGLSSIICEHYEIREDHEDLYTELLSNKIENIEKFSAVLYRIPKQLSGEDWPTADLRVQRISKEIANQGKLVREAYKNYILALKKALILT